EIGLPEADARKLVAALLADERVTWIGLAARDSLRLEAGLCLHGQDIMPEIDPVDAGLMWAIAKPVREKAAFVGAPKLTERIAQGPRRKRCGLRADGPQPVRPGAPLTDAEGGAVGTVPSGGFGPSAGHPVAMGYVGTNLAVPGTVLFAEVRGNRIPVTV